MRTFEQIESMPEGGEPGKVDFQLINRLDYASIFHLFVTTKIYSVFTLEYSVCVVSCS